MLEICLLSFDLTETWLCVFWLRSALDSSQPGDSGRSAGAHWQGDSRGGCLSPPSAVSSVRINPPLPSSLLFPEWKLYNSCVATLAGVAPVTLCDCSVPAVSTKAHRFCLSSLSAVSSDGLCVSLSFIFCGSLPSQWLSFLVQLKD